MSDYSPEGMRKRFWAVSREIEAVRAKSKPYRDEVDAIMAQIGPLLDRKRELAAKFKPIEAGLPALEEERTMLARALGNKVGEPQ